MVCLAIIIVTADLMFNGHYSSFGAALRDASFQVASISTTTGFATQDTTLWPPLSMSVLIICSLVCGCSGSTSGGIKIDRAILAAVNIAFGLDFITGVTSSIACIGNVGPGFGDVGSMSNYANFPTILKSTGMAEMLIGRLEIFPILYLMRSIRLG